MNRISYTAKLYIALLTLSFLVMSGCEKRAFPTPETTGNDYQQYGIPFDKLPPTKEIVMYEINLRSFSTKGNINGIIERLDAIKALNINVIWLMPIFTQGVERSVNSPYSIKDYKSVSSEYGSLEDLRFLVEEAHKRDIAVILDWVANHTSWDHEWISKKSWYTQDGSGNIIHPAGTNWEDVADLNFDNRLMKDAMIDAMKFWILEANVDGYRCDYADGVPFSFWKEAITSLRAIENRDIIMLAEGARSDHFDAGFDMNYAWDYYGTIKNVFNGSSAKTLVAKHQQEYNDISSGEKLRFTTNHDESAWDATPVQIFNGTEGALAASVSAILMGGVPLIYAGQEIGISNNIPFFSNAPINWNNNPEMLESYKQLLDFYVSEETVKRNTLVDYSTDDVLVFEKTHNEMRVLIIINVRNKPITLETPPSLLGSNWQNVFSSKVVSLENTIQLSNYEYRVLRKQ